MKFQAAVDGEKNEVEITREGDNVFARVDGRDYELEASEPELNVFLLKHEGKIFEVFVSPPKSADDPYAIRIGKSELEITLADPKRLRGTAAAAGDASGKAEIRTAMPGKVVRILKAVGDVVEKGDGIIVVEAMKMQNEMRSPKDGSVKEFRVAEGDTVAAGDVLVVVE